MTSCSRSAPATGCLFFLPLSFLSHSFSSSSFSLMLFCLKATPSGPPFWFRRLFAGLSPSTATASRSRLPPSPFDLFQLCFPTSIYYYYFFFVRPASASWPRSRKDTGSGWGPGFLRLHSSMGVALGAVEEEAVVCLRVS